MNNFEGAKQFTSFKDLCGITVKKEDVIDEITRLPLDGILGFLSGLSIEMIQAGTNFFSPGLQGSYLQGAIVDDFPQQIPTAFKMYSPGRIPVTGGRHIFIHEQNLAWLCHAALLFSKENSFTPEITYNLRCRLFRLLLIINDFLSEGTISKPYDLLKRQVLIHDWLRYGQYNRHFGHYTEILTKVARQKILISNILPKYYQDIEATFLNATKISLQTYFQIISLFIIHFHNGLNIENFWLKKETFLSNIKKGKKAIKIIMSRWIRNPEQYRNACTKWRKERKDMGKLPVYDFVPLRETPLIEARPGEWICPIPAFLFSKLEDEPFFIISDYLKKTNKSEMNKFHVALGGAYEEYAHELIERIAENDNGGKWMIKHSPRTKGHQLADSYLQRDKIAILFEHKGQRPGTEFLRGCEGERVVGPSPEILKRIENNEPVSYELGYKYDKGFITRGTWQQSKAGIKISSWAEKEFGEKPAKIYPVITLLSSLIIDPIIKKIYLNPLIQYAGLYKDNFWEKPQWLNISDLEALTAMAESGSLNLHSLLNEKVSKYENKRFDLFLKEKGAQIIDDKLVEEAKTILDNAALSFYKKGLSLKNQKTANK